MPVIQRGFERALERFSLAGLESDRSVIFGMNRACELTYLNPAWFDFARANQGEPAISTEWGLGRSVLDSMPAELLPFYQRAFDLCLVSGEPWKHDYECSSDDIHRRFHLVLYPLANRAGFLSVHALAVESTHAAAGRDVRAVDLEPYTDEAGLVHQCFHCRRVEHATHTDRWDWVRAESGKLPAEVSHSLCPTCLDFYYPKSL